MDHTPNHKTNFFISSFDSLEYKIPGVHHIVAINTETNKICLDHQPFDTTLAIYKGKIDVLATGDTIFVHNYNWNEFVGKNNVLYLYLPTLDTLIYLYSNGAGAKQPITDIWWDPAFLKDTTNIICYGFSKDNIKITDDALSVLANETLKLSDEYGFARPKTWIQPGGNFPLLYKEQLKTALEPLGFTTGAVYHEASKKVFNEYNPASNLNYAIQWGDFLEEKKDLEYNKSVIAHNIAKHKVMIGNTHFNPDDSWQDYLDRNDSLIAWAQENNIPIKTYSEWNDILFNQIPNPYQNIFPKLSVDLDKNNIPDGYNASDWGSSFDGLWENNDGVEESDGYCFSKSSEGGMFFVYSLGGIEKGENEFEFWSKGFHKDTIDVTFKFDEFDTLSNYNPIVYKFLANTENWTKYTLNESLNENKELIIPEDVTLISVYFWITNNNGGQNHPIKVSGMKLAKKQVPYFCYVKLKIFLEGTYNPTADSMEANLIDIPLISPYESDPKTVESLPAKTVDWVLVELRDKNNSSQIVKSCTAFLLSDGNIVDSDGGSSLKFEVAEDNYYIVIKHRNHIPVMSPETVHLHN